MSSQTLVGSETSQNLSAPALAPSARLPLCSLCYCMVRRGASAESLSVWLEQELCAAGTKLKLTGRLEEGFEHYRRAVAACPAYAPAFYNIGVIYSERRDFSAAKQYYGRALEVGPHTVHMSGYTLAPEGQRIILIRIASQNAVWLRRRAS